MEYGVLVNNKFDMFLDDCDDPLEILQRNEEEAKQKKLEKEKTAAKGSTKNAVNKKPAVTTVAKPTTKESTTKPASKPAVQNSAASESRANFDSNKTQPSDRPPRFAMRQQGSRQSTEGGNTISTRSGFSDQEGGQRGEHVAKFNEFREQRAGEDARGEGFQGRGGYRRGGRGGPPRGEGREGGFDRFGKREFDRHSGSDRGGLKPVDKRDGGGAHNWGTLKDDIDMKTADDSIAEKVEGERTGEQVVPGGEEEGGETGTGGVAVEAEPAVEEKQMTLDEWKNLKEQTRLKASFNIRQAGEGYNNDPKWKKMFQLKKKVDEEEEEEEEEEEDEDDAHGKQKNVVPIMITFNDNSRRGGGGGPGGRGGRGRGGARGGGPRGGGVSSRGPSQKAASSAEAPNVDDETDFPSLA